MRSLVMMASGLMLMGAAPDPAGAPAPFETLRLATALARAGAAQRDPLMLVAAARLRRSAGEQIAEGAPDRAAEWIARAEEMGAGDPRIASLVADWRAETRKGRAAGPRVSQALLRAGQRMSFAETFRAGRPAVVYVEGDGDTDIALRVGTACRDLSPGDVKICTWVPTRAERVTVEVANTGRIQNRVILGTN